MRACAPHNATHVRIALAEVGSNRTRGSHSWQAMLVLGLLLLRLQRRRAIRASRLLKVRPRMIAFTRHGSDRACRRTSGMRSLRVGTTCQLLSTQRQWHATPAHTSTLTQRQWYVRRCLTPLRTARRR